MKKETKMLFAIYTPEAITVHIPKMGPRKVFKSSPVYQEVYDLFITDINLPENEKLDDQTKIDKFLHIVDRGARIAKEIDGELKVEDNRFKLDGEYLPSLFCERLLKFEGTEVAKYLINMWKNLRNNPSERSRLELLAFLEKYQMAITPDGCFIAYKYVTDNFKDAHSGKFDNSPGKEVSMAREDVNADSNQTCSYGLHVAAFEYANSSGNRTVVAVKVNPADVVSIPFDYNGQKMRVCRYFVIEQITGEYTKPVYGESHTEIDITNADILGSLEENIELSDSSFTLDGYLGYHIKDQLGYWIGQIQNHEDAVYIGDNLEDLWNHFQEVVAELKAYIPKKIEITDTALKLPENIEASSNTMTSRKTDLNYTKQKRGPDGKFIKSTNTAKKRK